MYLKIWIGCLLLIFSKTKSYTQTQPVRNIAKFDTQYTLTDINGMPLNRNYIGLEGHPYFMNSYKYGNLELQNGRKFISIQLRLDLVAQEVVFLSPSKEAGAIGSDFIKAITITDTIEDQAVTYFFRTGLPAIDNYKSNQFCLVLVEGKISLLKSMVKSIDTRKNDYSGEILKEFALREDFFTFQKGVMSKFKREKESILTIMSDKRAEMEQFLKENKGNFKNEVYLAKIFKYYNSN